LRRRPRRPRPAFRRRWRRRARPRRPRRRLVRAVRDWHRVQRPLRRFRGRALGRRAGL